MLSFGIVCKVFVWSVGLVWSLSRPQFIPPPLPPLAPMRRWPFGGWRQAHRQAAPDSSASGGAHQGSFSCLCLSLASTDQPETIFFAFCAYARSIQPDCSTLGLAFCYPQAQLLLFCICPLSGMKKAMLQQLANSPHEIEMQTD